MRCQIKTMMMILGDGGVNGVATLVIDIVYVTDSL